jgi:hypothetical protein
MLEQLFMCGPAALARPPPRARELSTTGPNPNINLKIEDISKRLVIDVPDLLADLIEIATYVFVADQVTTRGGDRFLHMGRRWRRKFRFVIAVREPNRWSSPEVLGGLTDLLSFLSEDYFRFEFLPLPDAPSFKSYLDLNKEDAGTPNASEVILFSGGLDSLAGAVDELAAHARRLVLVSHRSSPTMFERQKYLARVLQERFPGRLLHVPVQITTGGGLRVAEYTQRTRAFLFAAIATAVALIVGAHRIRFFENGIMSFNLPIAPQIVGTRATLFIRLRAWSVADEFGRPPPSGSKPSGGSRAIARRRLPRDRAADGVSSHSGNARYRGASGTVDDSPSSLAPAASTSWEWRKS